MLELKVVTYEEERLNYFIEKRNKVQQKLDRLRKDIRYSELGFLSIEMEMLSDCGRELSFYNDVVDMLTNEMKRKKDGEKK